jgi:D-alanyl-D-alanine carboxypeptidase
MRKLAAVVLAFLFIVSARQAHKAYAEDDFFVSAKAVCVMDADTGKVIISKNMNMKLPPASTTKVMTAIVALEKTKPGDMFRVSRYAASMSPSKVYLRPGDEPRQRRCGAGLQSVGSGGL